MTMTFGRACSRSAERCKHHSALAKTQPSCMAANVATNAAIEMGMIDHIVMGTAMNSRKPAHLFARV